MKSKLFFLFLCMMAVMSFTGCKSEEETNRRDRELAVIEEKPVIPDIEWEDKIYEETIFEETPIDIAMAEAVKIKVKDVKEGSLTVKITAPDVGDEIIEWYEALPEEEFSEALMEEEIVRLIKAGEPQETDVTLPYMIDAGGNVMIDYPNAYYNKIYCGISAFFDYVSDLLYEEVMEAGEDEAND